ncbi:MAG: long-chain fatty acid--CoA ligase, partial [Caulobacteraceae bacterium]|nr:long-chain fatty acid--CoA ligase [Caulobacteraceae bacterium]
MASKLYEITQGVMHVDPAADAIEFEGAWWTWGDLSRIGDAIEAALAKAGLGANTRIGGVMRNRPETAAMMLALLTSDRCVVTLNPSLPDDRLAGDILALKPPAVIAFAQDWARPAVAEAARKIGCLGIELTHDRVAPVRLVPGLETVSGADLQREAAEGIAIEMLTSGTTGAPKRIPIKRFTLEQAVVDAGVYDNRGPDEAPKLRSGVTIFNSSFAHIAGFFALFNNVASGRKLSMMEKFNVAGWVDAVRRHRPKVAGAPPSALRMIIDAKVPKEDLASLVAFRAGTAPLDPELGEEFYDIYGIPVLQNYSATEFAGAGAGWTLEDFKKYHKEKRGSVGRVNPGIKARVIDAETGEPVAFGTQGLLELQAPHLGDGGWLRTTDLAVMDADDFLWIKGRADNAIIRGGFKIIPDDVVRAL